MFSCVQIAKGFYPDVLAKKTRTTNKRGGHEAPREDSLQCVTSPNVRPSSAAAENNLNAINILDWMERMS